MEAGPEPWRDGVVRWRLIDLVQWLWEEFRVSVSGLHEMADGWPLGTQLVLAVTAADRHPRAAAEALLRQKGGPAGVTIRRLRSAASASGPAHFDRFVRPVDASAIRPRPRSAFSNSAAVADTSPRPRLTQKDDYIRKWSRRAHPASGSHQDRRPQLDHQDPRADDEGGSRRARDVAPASPNLRRRQ